MFVIGLTLVFVINRVGRLIVKRKGMGKASAADISRCRCPT